MRSKSFVQRITLALLAALCLQSIAPAVVRAHEPTLPTLHRMTLPAFEQASQPGTLQAVPGCAADGYLRDPRTYFYSLINRQPGAPAPDWKEVLNPLGWVTNPLPGQVPVSQHYDITMQARGDGLVGRMFLPGERDPLGYFTAPVDYLTDARGGLCRDWQGVEGPDNLPTGRQFCDWAWIPLGGVYAPRRCGQALPNLPPAGNPSQPPQQPAGPSLTQFEESVRRIVDDAIKDAKPATAEQAKDIRDTQERIFQHQQPILDETREAAKKGPWHFLRDPAFLAGLIGSIGAAITTREVVK